MDFGKMSYGMKGIFYLSARKTDSNALMNNLAFTSWMCIVSLFGFQSLDAQTLVDFHTGYDFGFDAAYLGTGIEVNEKFLLTVEAGSNADQLIAKLDVAGRMLHFSDAQVDVFGGVGGGRAFSMVENGYDDWMAELFFSVQIRPFYIGYGLGFYLPEDPGLEGFGNYHYFRVGVLFDMR